MPQYSVAMLVGSTRKNSINQRLARAIEKLAPASLRFTWVAMDEMPFYNFDLEGNRPASVARFTDAIRAADAVCWVTPEYNRSIPAVLKNAIDWGSKPMDQNVWRNKTMAITGTTPGAIGTAIAQLHLRQILATLSAHVLPGETYISFKTPAMIDESGHVSDESVRNFIAAFVERFSKLIKRMAD